MCERKRWCATVSVFVNRERAKKSKRQYARLYVREREEEREEERQRK